MKESLGLNETHFRALFEQTNDGIFIISLDLKYLAVNQQAANMLGYTVEELVGMPVSAVVALEQRNVEGDYLHNPNGQHPVYERIFRKKDGTTIPVEISTSIVYDQDGSPLHIQSIARDITERVRLEQMKSDFINRASHELRTPLTTAILMTGLIREGGINDETKEYLDVLENELNRQKILIDRFLMVGRLESNMLRFNLESLKLLPILDDAIASLTPLAKKKGITIDLSSAKDIPEIIADQAGLQQVFVNLINNAIKYSPEKSTISIVIKKHTDTLSIFIKDQGLGIPSDDLPNLFEKFFRARNVTIAEIPGSGVGLYIVKSIVDELGGDLLVTSEEGSGTTFEVILNFSN